MKKFYLGILLLLVMQACGSYRQNIMFQSEDASLLSTVNAKEMKPRNYIIEANDRLKLDVYTKKGELLIDPENKLIDRESSRNDPNMKRDLNYLVQVDGSVIFPMVGSIRLEGLTLMEAEDKLVNAYEKFYKAPYVRLSYLNKRVIVLGAAGGQVIPIQSENTSVVEVLALVEGFEAEAKSHNIRLLRNDEAFVLDFSTIAGYQKNNMIVQNGDVIYVEPVRRPFSEFVKDNGPIISVFSSLASLIAVLISVK